MPEHRWILIVGSIDGWSWAILRLTIIVVVEAIYPASVGGLLGCWLLTAFSEGSQALLNASLVQVLSICLF